VNYGFWIYGDLDRAQLATALAEMLSLPPESVDVGTEDDLERNWDALVSCTLTPLSGELHWHLDIYVSKTVSAPPPEATAAAWLAVRLRTVVAYQALPMPPSAFWLVGPDGKRTRARIYEDDGPSYRIDAVERPIPALPGLRVSPIPEVIREYRVPTPLTDRLRSPEAGTVMNALGAWEGMVSRLSDGWPPDGWYPLEYYRQDLETRDDLETAMGALPEAARAEVAQALAEIDRRFAAATEDDGGEALSAGSPGWWWRRVPNPAPWHNAPAS
jgi:hypothetical protein